MFTVKMQELSVVLKGKPDTMIRFSIPKKEQPILSFEDKPQNGKSISAILIYPSDGINPYIGKVLFVEQDGKKVFYLKNGKSPKIYFLTKCKFEEK